MIRVAADCVLKDFEEFCAAAKSEHQLVAMESREKHQCMHMSCLRRMANSGSCLRELAFVFTLAYLLLASHDYFVVILILGNFFPGFWLVSS